MGRQETTRPSDQVGPHARRSPSAGADPTAASAAGLEPLPPELLRQRALRLEYFTVGWNMVEAVVGLLAGLLASSIALKAFGLDSVIETFSGAILLWRLKQRGLDEARAESRAIRLVSLTFFALAAYVAAEALADLWFRRAPQFSLLGMILASCSLLVMPALGVAKRQIAVLLKSSALSADGLRTLLCAYLSATLLIGLALNGWLGWWWADPTAALAMTGFMIWEGIETFSKKPSQA